MQKPLNVKLRKGDEVVDTSITDHNPDTRVTTRLIITKMGFFFKLTHFINSGLYKIEAIWTDQEAIGTNQDAD